MPKLPFQDIANTATDAVIPAKIKPIGLASNVAVKPLTAPPAIVMALTKPPLNTLERLATVPLALKPFKENSASVSPKPINVDLGCATAEPKPTKPSLTTDKAVLVLSSEPPNLLFKTLYKPFKAVPAPPLASDALDR